MTIKLNNKRIRKTIVMITIMTVMREKEKIATKKT